MAGINRRKCCCGGIACNICSPASVKQFRTVTITGWTPCTNCQTTNPRFVGLQYASGTLNGVWQLTQNATVGCFFSVTCTPSPITVNFCGGSTGTINSTALEIIFQFSDSTHVEFTAIVSANITSGGSTGTVSEQLFEATSISNSSTTCDGTHTFSDTTGACGGPGVGLTATIGIGAQSVVVASSAFTNNGCPSPCPGDCSALPNAIAEISGAPSGNFDCAIGLTQSSSCIYSPGSAAGLTSPNALSSMTISCSGGFWTATAIFTGSGGATYVWTLQNIDNTPYGSIWILKSTSDGSTPSLTTTS